MTKINARLMRTLNAARMRKQVKVYMTDEVKARIDLFAKVTGSARADVIEELVMRHLAAPSKIEE